MIEFLWLQRLQMLPRQSREFTFGKGKGFTLVRREIGDYSVKVCQRISYSLGLPPEFGRTIGTCCQMTPTVPEISILSSS